MSGSAGHGWSLIELMVVLSVMLLGLGVALPEIGSLLDRRRLYAAADSMVQLFHGARHAALRLGVRVYVRIEGVGGERWRLSAVRQVTCNVVESCGVQTLASDEFAGVLITSTTFPLDTSDFDPVRSLANNGRVRLQGRDGSRLDVVLSSVGRARLCVPPGSHAQPFAGVARC